MSFLRSRLGTLLLLSSVLVGAGSLEGCHKAKSDDAKKTAVKLNGDAARASLAALAPKLEALNKRFAELHKQIDPLPPDLPGFSEVRAKFYNTDIGMGVMGPKLTWLGERLDAALKAGNAGELEQVTKDIARTHDEFSQIDRIALEVLHQALPFERSWKLRTGSNDGSFVRTLAKGPEIRATAGGLEQRLLEFLDDPARKVDKTTWFDFDENSKEQLDNVAQILKAYPSAKLRLASYPETSDAAAAAKKVDVKRAELVKRALVHLGIAAPRLSAEGSTTDHPTCTASGDKSCASAGGRLAARVTAK